MTIIVNADDFGWTHGHNVAVERANQHGILTHASLMATGEAFDEAVEISQRIPLQVGVHLTLNETKPLSTTSRLSAVMDRDGEHFHDSPLRLAGSSLLSTIDKAAVITEWRCQIERVRTAGVGISHLDSHKHVHLLPPLLTITISLAREYGISYVRVPHEQVSSHRPSSLLIAYLSQLAKSRLHNVGLQFADHFFGFAQSGHISVEDLRRFLRHRDGTTEIMVHPAVITPGVERLKGRFKWARDYQFERELDALTNSDIKVLFQQRGEGEQQLD